VAQASCRLYATPHGSCTPADHPGGRDDRAELVAPSLRHARSYVAALREGFRRGAQERVSEQRIRQIEADFATYIEAVTDQTGRVRLPTGQIVPKVPFSVFWLVPGDEFIGETHVRHHLND
jgi:predicted acetyltransferase